MTSPRRVKYDKMCREGGEDHHRKQVFLLVFDGGVVWRPCDLVITSRLVRSQQEVG